MAFDSAPTFVDYVGVGSEIGKIPIFGSFSHLKIILIFVGLFTEPLSEFMPVLYQRKTKMSSLYIS